MSDADAQAYYVANKARFGTSSEADALGQIKAGLGQQRQNERRAAFASELRAKYDVKVLLEPYRVPVEVGSAPVRGNPRAPVTIVEFSDFQCPYCVRARPSVARVREVYGDQVRFAFRHFPLDFHPQAEKAGEGAACAGEQGKFWEMHDLLWTNTARLQVPDLKAHAVTLGLDAAAFGTVPRLGPLLPPRRERPRSRPGLRGLGDPGVLRQRPAPGRRPAVRGVRAGHRRRAGPPGARVPGPASK